jgi:hypothetical protein
MKGKNETFTLSSFRIVSESIQIMDDDVNNLVNKCQLINEENDRISLFHKP